MSGAVVAAVSESREPVPAFAGVRLSKSFPGVQALDAVDFNVRHGEIHALLGENGAGKSTLLKILTGDQRADSGSLAIDGKQITLADPHDARERGITIVPQDILVVPELSIGRNILLGYERVRAPKNGMNSTDRVAVQAALERVGASFSPDTLAKDLSVPELRLAQLARCVVRPGEVILLDEPTAVLSEADAEHLLARLTTFREEGKALIYVTHRLSEALRIADRVTVLRDGRCVGTFPTAELDKDRIVALMADRDSTGDQGRRVVAKSTSTQDQPVLRVVAAGDGEHFRDISFEASAGQIVGIAGVQGSGHGQLLKSLAGSAQVEQGTLSVDGRQIAMGSLQRSFEAGIVMVPADRKGAGIVGTQTLRSNVVLTPRARSSVRRWGIRWSRRETKTATEYIDAFDIRPPTSKTLVKTLSGGNQQKVALSRALEGRPRVLLLEEPTQGIDVNAKREIRRLLLDTVNENSCVAIVATSDFEELLGLAETIHVMCSGRLVATLDGNTATYREILHHALP